MACCLLEARKLEEKVQVQCNYFCSKWLDAHPTRADSKPITSARTLITNGAPSANLHSHNRVLPHPSHGLFDCQGLPHLREEEYGPLTRASSDELGVRALEDVCNP